MRHGLCRASRSHDESCSSVVMTVTTSKCEDLCPRQQITKQQFSAAVRHTDGLSHCSCLCVVLDSASNCEQEGPMLRVCMIRVDLMMAGARMQCCFLRFILNVVFFCEFSGFCRACTAACHFSCHVLRRHPTLSQPRSTYGYALPPPGAASSLLRRYRYGYKLRTSLSGISPNRVVCRKVCSQNDKVPHGHSRLFIEPH